MEDNREGLVGPSSVDNRSSESSPPPYAFASGPPDRQRVHGSRNSTWIIAVSIFCGFALVAGALYFGLRTSDPPSAALSTESSEPTAAASEEAGSTCESWEIAKLGLDSIPPLPSGWNYETPGIDVYIGNYVEAVTRALDDFEPRILQEPHEVADAAHRYVSAKRLEVAELASYSFTGENTASGNSALAALNELCDVA